MKMYLAINECPRHHHKSICIETEDGSGVRITPNKCCGRWKTTNRWLIDASLKANLIEELEKIEVE